MKKLLTILGLSLSVTALAAPPKGVDRLEVGSVSRVVREAERLGAADPDLPLSRIVLVLPLRDRAGLDRLLAAQQDPASPDYRRWLTPEQFGARFGAPEQDVAALERWLSEQGFDVEGATPGRTALLFSGRAWQVSRSFGTSFGEFYSQGKPGIANESAPTMPAALASRVTGLLSLDGFGSRRPLFNYSGNNVGPGDFARIYGVEPLYQAGLDGRGRKIAILAQTKVYPGDVTFFRQFFGLPPNEPTMVSNGPEPGISSADAIEASLDLQWAGAVAPAASVILVASKTTLPTYGVDLSAIYAVNQNLADVIGYSYGACEQELSDAENALYTNTWAQAAAQGISVFVASGDSGAASCESANAQTGLRPAVNGLGSSPYSTSVGGTQFVDGGSPSTYWETTNDPVTKRSVKSYIPEAVWNESGVAGGSGLLASGGGASLLHDKPSWQACLGVPNDGRRSLPDVALGSAARNGTVIAFNHVPDTVDFRSVSGTSVAAPMFAGLAALLAQAVGGRVGNLNPTLYALGRDQYEGGRTNVFHDVTTGSNTVKGVTGFDAGIGYDQATGLGSVDAAALVAAWPALEPPADVDLFFGARPALLATAGTPVGTLLTLDSRTGTDVVAAVTIGSLPAGVTATFTPTVPVWPSATGGTGTTGTVSTGVPASLLLVPSSTTPSGTYPVDLTARVAYPSGRTLTRSVRLMLTVGSKTIVVPAGPELQVPVVLDAYGASSSHYTSDLSAVNRGATDVTLLLRYVPVPGSPGEGGPVIARSLPAGRQLFVPDVLAFLGANGYAIPKDTTGKLGTLFLTFQGGDATTVFAGSRTSTPNPSRKVGGAFGTFSAAVPSGTATATETFVYGLRENAAFRSNLAVVHSPAAGSSFATQAPITLEVQLYDGDTGLAAGAAIPLSLAPGEFRQLNSVLSTAGLTNGYARVRKTVGSDRFITYGVVNDGGAGSATGTSDGSLIVSGGSAGLVPIVLDVPATTRFRTELVLTNPSTTSPANVSLRYTPALVLGGGGGGTVSTTLAPGRQLIVADGIAYLRSLGLAIPADDSRQGGTLLVTGAVAQGRTYNPNPDLAVGGTFGVSYPAQDVDRRATRGALVFGLRQDDSVRSNLALADARAASEPAIEYTIEIYDAGSGATAPAATLTRSLTGGQWVQLDSVLFPAGVTYGYVRVRPTRGTSDFVAYGVVNDGPTAGSRTSDGSYLPMVLE